MELEKKIADFLARAETKTPRSKLEPYDELIRTLRQRRWTYQEIAKALSEDFRLKINPRTIWDYLHVHTKPREATSHSEARQEKNVSVKTPKYRFNLDA